MAPSRKNAYFGNPYEESWGCSQAVRAGDLVFVSGCTSLLNDKTVAHLGDAYGQAIAAMGTITKALEKAGATLHDVVRTRVFFEDLADFDDIQRAHREVFGAIQPASTAVRVVSLSYETMALETEADAVVSGRN